METAFFPFSALPAELRQRVYAFIAESDRAAKSFVPQPETMTRAAPCSLDFHAQKPRRLDIRQTARAIRDEFDAACPHAFRPAIERALLATSRTATQRPLLVAGSRQAPTDCSLVPKEMLPALMEILRRYDVRGQTLPLALPRTHKERGSDSFRNHRGTHRPMGPSHETLSQQAENRQDRIALVNDAVRQFRHAEHFEVFVPDEHRPDREQIDRLVTSLEDQRSFAYALTFRRQYAHRNNAHSNQTKHLPDEFLNRILPSLSLAQHLYRLDLSNFDLFRLKENEDFDICRDLPLLTDFRFHLADYLLPFSIQRASAQNDLSRPNHFSLKRLSVSVGPSAFQPTSQADITPFEHLSLALGRMRPLEHLTLSTRPAEIVGDAFDLSHHKLLFSSLTSLADFKELVVDAAFQRPSWSFDFAQFLRSERRQPLSLVLRNSPRNEQDLDILFETISREPQHIHSLFFERNTHGHEGDAPRYLNTESRMMYATKWLQSKRIEMIGLSGKPSQEGLGDLQTEQIVVDLKHAFGDRVMTQAEIGERRPTW